MKAINKFKNNEPEDKYENAKNALATTALVLAATFLLSLINERLALVFIIFYLVFTVSLIRWTQQANK